MDRLTGMAFGVNYEVFKEPRGLLRVILFFLAIFAFATTVDPYTESGFKITCPDGSVVAEEQKIDYGYKYPFMLKEYDPAEFEYKECDTGKTVKQTPCCNFNSAAQFYVFVGVMAFLYCIASLILYVFFDEKWRNMDLIPIADFIVAIVFCVLFLIASSAWADSLTDLKHYTDPEEVYKARVPECDKDGVKCEERFSGNFATLNVSVIFGFLNMFVWGASVWFLLKETKWWNRDNSNVPTPQITTPQFSTPQAPSPDQSHI